MKLFGLLDYRTRTVHLSHNPHALYELARAWGLPETAHDLTHPAHVVGLKERGWSFAALRDVKGGRWAVHGADLPELQGAVVATRRNP